MTHNAAITALQDALASCQLTLVSILGAQSAVHTMAQESPQSAANMQIVLESAQHYAQRAHAALLGLVDHPQPADITKAALQNAQRDMAMCDVLVGPSKPWSDGATSRNIAQKGQNPFAQ